MQRLAIGKPFQCSGEGRPERIVQCVHIGSGVADAFGEQLLEMRVGIVSPLKPKRGQRNVENRLIREQIFNAGDIGDAGAEGRDIERIQIAAGSLAVTAELDRDRSFKTADVGARARVAKAESLGEIEPATVAQTVGETGIVIRPAFQDELDESPLVDLILQPVGCQSNFEEPAISQQVVSRTNRRDVLFEVLDIARDLDRGVMRFALKRFSFAEQPPSGDTR